MGCTSSTPVTAPEPIKPLPKTNGETSANGTSNAGINKAAVVPHESAAQTTSKKAGNASSANTAPSLPKGSDDVHWNRLWDAHRDFLLDPADVHSTIEDLMARACNKLSPAELTLIQRKVRKVLRKTGTQDAKKGNLFGKSSSLSALDQENRVIAERYHLLTNNAIQQILPTITLAEVSSVNPVTAIFVLLIYSHESLWDRTADIAVESAKAAGFSMDVNALKPPSRCPSIPRAASKDPIDLPLGVSLHSLTFMIGLALRKLKRLHIYLVLLRTNSAYNNF